MSFKILFLFFWVPSFGLAQSSELVFLKGKIVCTVRELRDVNVTNLRSETTTITNYNGDYSMFVKTGDTLQFSSLQIVTKKVIVQDIDLSKSLFVTTLEPKVIPLDEVKIVEYKNINAVALGILEKPAKKYTSAERKLKAATDYDVGYYRIPMPNIFFSVDPIINAISGRTSLLKDELRIERKEKTIKKIEKLFESDYFINKLKIPKNNYRGFLFYIADNDEIEVLLATKNKIQIEFILSKLAVEYNQIQTYE